MAEQKRGEITDEIKSLIKVVDDQSVKKLQKDGDSSVKEIGIRGNKDLPIISETSDDDDETAFFEAYNDVGHLFGSYCDDSTTTTHAFGTRDLHYFPTSPFDVLYVDDTYFANHSGGGGHAYGITTSNDQVTTTPNNGSRGDGGEASSYQSLESLGDFFDEKASPWLTVKRKFLKNKQKLFNSNPCVIGRKNKKRDGGLTSETPLNLDDEDDGDNDRPRPPGNPRSEKSQPMTLSSVTGMGNTSCFSFCDSINDQMAKRNPMKAEILAQIMEPSIEIKRVQRAKQRNLDMEFLRIDVSEYPEEAREMIQQQKAQIMNNLATRYYDV